MGRKAPGARRQIASPGVPLITDSQTREGFDLRLNFDRRLTVEQKNEAVAWYEKERAKFGWPELICYARDEPRYPDDAALVRGESGKFRDVRMRLATAMNANAAYWLGLWQLGFDGCMNWAHTHTKGSMGPGEIGHGGWGNAIRTEDGVLDTLRWERHRAGVDDIRYLTTLLDALDRATWTYGDEPIVAQTLAWLAALDVRTIDLDATRHERLRHGSHISAFEELINSNLFKSQVGLAAFVHDADVIVVDLRQARISIAEPFVQEQVIFFRPGRSFVKADLDRLV